MRSKAIAMAIRKVGRPSPGTSVALAAGVLNIIELCGLVRTDSASPIFTASSDDAPQVIVKAGLFADEQLAPPTISVFEDSKAPWIQIQKQ